MLKKFDAILVKLGILAIKFYQRWLSLLFPSGRCIYEPSCSQYCLECFKKYGFIKGFRLGFLRIARCHPYEQPRKDPVP